MLKNRKVWINDNLVPWQDATVHLMSHSVGRGSTIFEVLSLHGTASGAALFRLDQHVQRFLQSAELLGMTLPVDADTLALAIRKTAAHNDIRQGMIKVVGYYPEVAFGILPPPDALEIAVFAIDPDEDLGGLNFPFDTGTTACLASWRKLDPTTVPIQAKAAANYLNGMMARREAADRGFESAILLDTQGFVAEGPTESVFLVQEGQLLAPVLGTILDGISRRSILQLAADMGLAVRQERLPQSLLFSADEIFFSGTPNKILPVRTIETRHLQPVPGPVTQRLSQAMNEIITGNNPAYQDWLFLV